jgi:drug/metabolite transporter (DMT)-like permease
MNGVAKRRETSIVLLRLSYWIAAIADFVVAALVLMPSRMGAGALQYPMGLASAAVFSWGVMLLVADRRPLERRWMLVPTALVVALLTLVRTIFALQGAIPFSAGILAFGTGLTALICYSYYHAGRSAGNDRETGPRA